MRFQSFVPKIRLVLIGVALGLLARYLLGEPVGLNDKDRRFTAPLDQTRFESVDLETPEFPLLKAGDSNH